MGSGSLSVVVQMLDVYLMQILIHYLPYNFLSHVPIVIGD